MCILILCLACFKSFIVWTWCISIYLKKNQQTIKYCTLIVNRHFKHLGSSEFQQSTCKEKVGVSFCLILPVSDLQSMRTVLRDSVWECLHACVTLSGTACLRGGSFLTCFLCCQNILCVSDYLSSQALSSAYSLITPLLLLLRALSLCLSSSPLPAILLLSFFFLFVFFFFSLSLCILQDMWNQGREVGGFLDLSSFFFKCPFIHIQPPKTKNKRGEERRKKCLHEMLPLENLTGAVHNFASLLFELFNLFSIYLIHLNLLRVPVFFTVCSQGYHVVDVYSTNVHWIWIAFLHLKKIKK